MLAVILFYVVYHLGQRNIPHQVNPAASLFITYSICLILSLVMFLWFPAPEGIRAAFAQVNWVSYALAIGVVGLEVGFLLVYRSGWKLSMAAIYSNVSVALLLIPIGMIFYQERLTKTNTLGVVFAILGIVLMGLK